MVTEEAYSPTTGQFLPLATESEHTHVWRFSNSRDLFYCTVTGCTETDRGD